MQFALEVTVLEYSSLKHSQGILGVKLLCWTSTKKLQLVIPLVHEIITFKF
jgi:hypothetical protein